MNSNETGKNIANAFNVIYKTYENVIKLISFLKSQAELENTYTKCFSSDFLRYRSDPDIYGWASSSIILAFQSMEDAEYENSLWREGPIYVMEIDLCGKDNDAVLHIARFDYDSALFKKDNPLLSYGDHWFFNEPLIDFRGKVIDYKIDDGKSFYGVIRKDAATKRYWGLQSVRGVTVPLVDVTSENAYDIVFGGFDKLSFES